MQVCNDLRIEICPLCGSPYIFKVGSISYQNPTLFSNWEILLQFKPELWRCKICSSDFTQNAIPEQQAKQLYSKGNAGERWVSEPFDQIKPKIITETLARIFTFDQRVLDIGCNTGELLDFAKARGCDTTGVEFSEESRAVLKSKGHKCAADIDEITGRFDVITAFDLIEHLYDIKSFLAICHKRLNSNGRLVILTGDVSCLTARLTGSKWWYISYPEHIVFPSVKLFQSETGFSIESTMKTYHSFNYIPSSLGFLKGLIINLLLGRYIGLPSIGPDHMLILLRKSGNTDLFG